MSWRLLFSGTNSAAWLALVSVAILVTVGVSLWLLRYERKFVSRTVGYLLITLRLAILALLCCTMLQPVLTKSWDKAVQGRVVVAMDVSESMQTVDRHASTAEKLRWAQALGMLGNAETSSLITEWIEALESGQQPLWLGRDHPVKTDSDRELAASRKRQIADTLKEFDRMSRREFVSRLMQSQDKPFIEDMQKRLPVDLRLFASEQNRVSDERLSEALLAEQPDLIPTGTNAVGMLSELISEESSVALRAVVLVSDGRQTTPGDIASEAQRLGSLQVPIYTVPVGSVRVPRDLSIVMLDHPQSVFIRDAVQVTATLSTTGFEGQPLSVRLEKDGVTIDQREVIPSTSTTPVAFSIPTETAGHFTYEIITDVQEGELRDDNNSRDVSFQVVDNKARVLLVDGDARWEFRYLRNLLERDEQIELSTVLFHQPRVGLLNDSFLPKTLPEPLQLKGQLDDLDLLILGDIPAKDLNLQTWDLIEAAVVTQGLSVVVVPGRRHMPQEFQSEKLMALLPVTDFTQRLAERYSRTEFDSPQSSFRLRPTPDGNDLAMFQSTDAGGGDAIPRAEEFGDVAGHPWMYAAKPRPGATVWAEGVHPGGASAEPVIVHQHYGFGQVVWMGIDSTWRWRKRIGDSLHHRFWGQFVRWAARNKAAAGNDQVRFALSETVIDETQTVVATARWDQSLRPLLTTARIEVLLSEVSDDGNSGDAGQTNPESVQSIVLNRSNENPDLFSARLPRMKAGTWRAELRLSESQIEMDEGIACDLVVHPHMSAELSNVSCNRQLLQEMADLSGGRMVEPYHLDQLLQFIVPRDESSSQLEEKTLWDHWLLLVIMFGLLMAEWVTRKLNGLP
ncbi:MAG: hypothetical protein KDA91_17875 [Planctomycetaceae bacterium]|nr:hypothetical protein [Planctomycetaceae bacterium]